MATGTPKHRLKVRIFPDEQAKEKLAQTFGCCRAVYNHALWLIKSTSTEQPWPTQADRQSVAVTAARANPETPWFKEVSSHALQQSLRDLNTALSNYFESKRGKRKGPKVGFPVFKKKSSKASARFTKNSARLKGESLSLAKVGDMKVKWTTPIPKEFGSVTIIRTSCDEYYASFVVDVPAPLDLAPIRESVGIDLGIKTFAHLSTGEKIESPGYKRLNRRIARAHRKLSRHPTVSKRGEKTRLHLAKLHAKKANIRKDFLHKTSTKIIRENQTVALENLNVSGMVKNRRLSRSISEQGWRMFRTMLEYKATRYKGREVVVISRWEPTSQRCSACQSRWGKIDVSIRQVKCINCGSVHDRDENAAKNIESSGLELAHDVKRTLRSGKTPLGAQTVDASSTLNISMKLGLFKNPPD